MADTSKIKKQSVNLEAMFPAKVLEAQEHNAEIMTSANEIIIETAQAIEKNQMEFLQQEAGQASKALAPIKLDSDASAAINASGKQWHANSIKLINHMRTINDLAFNCGWQLFKLGAASFHQLPKYW